MVYRLASGLYPFAFLANLLVFLFRRSSQYDVIHVHTLNSPFIAATIAGFVLRKPVVVKVTRSGTGAQLSRYHASWRKIVGAPVFRHVSRFVAITQDVKGELLFHGVSPRKITEIPNGVLLPEQPHKPDPSSGCRFIYVGRLIRRKRVDLLLHAWAEGGLDRIATLRIVGDGPERARLEDMVEHLGLAASVTLSGAYKHTELMQLMADSDVFVLPSDSEGMSNALLEAMAYGLGVIATRLAANRTLIGEGVNGLLFSGREELAEALRQLGRSPELRAELGARARQTISERYSFARIASDYRRLYEELLASAG